MPFRLPTTIILTTLLMATEAVVFLWPTSILQLEQFDLTVTTPLDPKELVVQELPIEQSNFSALIIYLGPVASQISGPIQVDLTQGEQSIYSLTTDAAAYTANPFLPLDFDTQPESQGVNYTLTVSAPQATLSPTSPSTPPLSFFSIPQYEVHQWTKVRYLAERININHGGIIPPGVTYLLLTVALWMGNLFIVEALKHIQSKIFRFQR